MGEAEVTIAARGSDSAVTGILGLALDEIRWRHPNVRVSCGALLGPTVRILVCSAPSATRSLEGLCAVEQDATDFVALLETEPEIIVVDVAKDRRVATMSHALRDDETRAAAIVPLRVDGAVVGFLQADLAQPGPIEPAVLEQLHQTTALASATIRLERERTRSAEYFSQIQQLRTSMSRRAARQRKAGHRLQKAVALLREMAENAAPGVDQAERVELGALIHRCAEQVDMAIDCLDEPGPRAPLEDQQHAAS